MYLPKEIDKCTGYIVASKNHYPFFPPPSILDRKANGRSSVLPLLLLSFTTQFCHGRKCKFRQLALSSD